MGNVCLFVHLTLLPFLLTILMCVYVHSYIRMYSRTPPVSIQAANLASMYKPMTPLWHVGSGCSAWLLLQLPPQTSLCSILTPLGLTWLPTSLSQISSFYKWLPQCHCLSWQSQILTTQQWQSKYPTIVLSLYHLLPHWLPYSPYPIRRFRCIHI